MQLYLERLKIQRINECAARPSSKTCINLSRLEQSSQINSQFNRQNAMQPLNAPLSAIATMQFDPYINNRDIRVPLNTTPLATKVGKKSEINGSDKFSDQFGDQNDPGFRQNGQVETYNTYGAINHYRNPYEYGAPQRDRSFGLIQRGRHLGPYSSNDEMMAKMGLSRRDYVDEFGNGIRNVNVESPLIQGELGRAPRRNNVTQQDVSGYAFNQLPFDPQKVVWEDNYPLGGVSTRVDRLNSSDSQIVIFNFLLIWL